MRGEYSFPDAFEPNRTRRSKVTTKERPERRRSGPAPQPAASSPIAGPFGAAICLAVILGLSVWLFMSVTTGAAWEHRARLASSALDNTTVELRRSTNALAALEEQHQSATSVLAQTLDENQKQGAQISHLQQHAGRLSNALQQEHSMYEADTADLQNHVNQEYQLRQQQAANAREDRRAAQRQVNAAEQQQAAIAQENQNLLSSGQQLAQENNQLAQQANNAAATAQSWKSEADQANQNAQRLQSTLSNAESLNVSLQIQLNRAAAEEQRLRGTVSHMESETSELHRRIEILEAEIRQKDANSNNNSNQRR